MSCNEAKRAIDKAWEDAVKRMEAAREKARVPTRPKSSKTRREPKILICKVPWCNKEIPHARRRQHVIREHLSSAFAHNDPVFPSTRTLNEDMERRKHWFSLFLRLTDQDPQSHFGRKLAISAIIQGMNADTKVSKVDFQQICQWAKASPNRGEPPKTRFLKLWNNHLELCWQVAEVAIISSNPEVEKALKRRFN